MYNLNIGLKIKSLVSVNKFKISDFANELEISSTAVHDIFKKPHINTLQLYKISTILDVPMTYWFEEKETLVLNEGKSPYLVKDNNFLKKQIVEKDKTINFLMGEINEIKGKEAV